MIVVRAPYRFSIGGGGTDLPSYYSKFGGSWVSAAINKYVYLIVKPLFDKKYHLSYSKTEIVDSVDEIKHPLIREALKIVGIEPGIEIISIADLPSNSGMGSSGAFTVALLTALHKFMYTYGKRHGMPDRKEIAEQACHIELDLLKEPSGKQDQYIAAYGGITQFEIDQQGEVEVNYLYPDQISEDTLRELENHLMMFYTGLQRRSIEALSAQKEDTEKNENDIVENLHKVKELGAQIKKALISENPLRFGELMHEHWENKRKRRATSGEQIDEWYEIARSHGAVGGKIMGAGGGGFFLLYFEGRKKNLRDALEQAGLREVAFRFDFEGVKTIANIT